MCSMSCGSLNPTKYILDGSCRAFGNKDGVLFCDKDMENDANIPKGFYENECGGCSFDEKTRILTCKRCQTPENGYLESTVEVKEGCIVVNDRGTLRCRDESKPSLDGMADDNAKKGPEGYKKEL